MSGCLTRVELQRLIEADLEPAAQQAAERHLEECRQCREALLALAGPVESCCGARAVRPEPQASPALQSMIQALAHQGAAVPNDPAAEALAAIVERLEPSSRDGTMGCLGPYDLLELIEAGGMGVVLRAHDPSLQRMVALKVLYPALAASPAARQRFLREARLAAAIRHEHVVTVFSVAEARGLPFFTMELIQGESLARRLQRDGPLPNADLVRLAREMTAGLTAAHAQGIIHRDIKPANVLIEAPGGRAKLTDFGLARAVDDTGLTRGGFVPGTPEYLSPEQAQGRPADERSDLFSLGCVLYAAATGRSPFRADTTLATLRRVCDATPERVRDLNAAVPTWFAEVVERLLEKDPSRRPATATALSHLLDSGASLVLTSPAVRPRRRRRWPCLGWKQVLAFGCLALLAGVTTNALRKRAHNARPVAEPAMEGAPFVVFDATDRRISAHTDVQAAIGAIPSNGILRLCWDGPRTLPPVVLPAHPVSIERAARFNPLWVATQADGPAILATAPLTLAGPEFEYDPPPEAGTNGIATPEPGQPMEFPGDTIPSGLALLRVVGAPVRLEGTRFRTSLPRGANRRGFACVQLDDCPRCEIHTSLLEAQHAVGIVWRFGTGAVAVSPERVTLAVTESGINTAGSDAIWFTATPRTAARLVIERIAFGGRTVLFLAPDLRRAASLDIRVDQIQIASDWLLVDRRKVPVPALRDWITWAGDPTQSRPARGFIPGLSRDELPLVPDEPAWRRFWGSGLGSSGSRN